MTELKIVGCYSDLHADGLTIIRQLARTWFNYSFIGYSYRILL